MHPTHAWLRGYESVGQPCHRSMIQAHMDGQLSQHGSRVNETEALRQKADWWQSQILRLFGVHVQLQFFANSDSNVMGGTPVSYTHLTLPTKRIV